MSLIILTFAPTPAFSLFKALHSNRVYATIDNHDNPAGGSGMPIDGLLCSLESHVGDHRHMPRRPAMLKPHPARGQEAAMNGLRLAVRRPILWPDGTRIEPDSPPNPSCQSISSQQIRSGDRWTPRRVRRAKGKTAMCRATAERSPFKMRSGCCSRCAYRNFVTTSALTDRSGNIRVSAIIGSDATFSRWVSFSASRRTANHAGCAAASFITSPVKSLPQRISRSVTGMANRDRDGSAAMPSMYRFPSSAEVPSFVRARDRRIRYTSTPGSAGFVAATYSIPCNEFMPSCSGRRSTNADLAGANYARQPYLAIALVEISGPWGSIRLFACGRLTSLHHLAARFLFVRLRTISLDLAPHGVSRGGVFIERQHLASRNAGCMVTHSFSCSDAFLFKTATPLRKSQPSRQQQPICAASLCRGFLALHSGSAKTRPCTIGFTRGLVASCWAISPDQYPDRDTRIAMCHNANYPPTTPSFVARPRSAKDIRDNFHNRPRRNGTDQIIKPHRLDDPIRSAIVRNSSHYRGLAGHGRMHDEPARLSERRDRGSAAPKRQ